MIRLVFFIKESVLFGNKICIIFVLSKIRRYFMLELLQNRRTIRQYSEKEIPEALLRQLLLTACRASTTGNMQ